MIRPGIDMRLVCLNQLLARTRRLKREWAIAERIHVRPGGFMLYGGEAHHG